MRPKDWTERIKISEQMAAAVAGMPKRIASQRPLVHMIPNSVTVALCTDGISALGARPLMAVAQEEMNEIPAYADAVVVNMGQPGPEKLRAARLALETAASCGVPIVWDPVGAGASAFRRKEFLSLLSVEWKGIIKGNQSEIATLQTGDVSHQGIDSIGEFSLCTHAADGRVWAVSGQEDLIFDGKECFSFAHECGNRLRLTGSGCLTGAVMGACHAVEQDAKTAAAAAFFIMAYAGEKAGRYRGYGSQKTALLDELSQIDPAKFSQYVEDAICTGRFGRRQSV